ncbi:MAG: Ribosomal large subunit pseudouridine synthase C [Chlamydiae bacterium]|nr:Ribosomal large subunit pseudouridine synthase C [Chlamydiota bacterium]
MEPIHCDNHVLVLNKPPGIATQPDFHEQAKAWVKKAFNKPGAVFLEPVHRLDKPVGGLVLFARTSKALSRLNEAMRERQVHKIYHAIVEGKLEGSGRLKHTLLHGDHRAIVDPSGKEALLDYRVLETGEDQTLVEIELLTGRYHQIRAQFAAIGHPIVGDQKYGSRSKKDAIYLAHVKLSFPHPTTKEMLVLCHQSFHKKMAQDFSAR